MTLYIVATPIGNLKDITLRALEVLKEVDFILCEDTRKTKKLLTHYDIHKPLMAFHQHSLKNVFEKISVLLKSGKNLALVTEAGTPGISDPGGKLISFLVEQDFPKASLMTPPTNGFRIAKLAIRKPSIIPIPGPSALTAALSIAGVASNQFLFLGFPPAKKGRKKYFNRLAELNEEFPDVLYESPHRFLKTLDNLIAVLGEDKKIIVCRELTKIYEEIFRGSLKKARAHFKNEIKGEFVLIIN